MKVKMIYMNMDDAEDAKGTVQVIDVEDNLHEYYNLLHCSMVEIVPRHISGKRFMIICDEEGCFVSHPKISAINKSAEVMFVGSLLICAENRGSDGAYVFRDLSDDEITEILNSIRIVRTKDHMAGLRMITDCEY